jgi:hypothetical protein
LLANFENEFMRNELRI